MTFVGFKRAPVAKLDGAPGFESVPVSARIPENPVFIGLDQGPHGSEKVRKRLAEAETAGSTETDRSSASGAEGHRFESCRARHFTNPFPSRQTAFSGGFLRFLDCTCVWSHLVRNGQKTPQHTPSEHQKLADKLVPRPRRPAGSGAARSGRLPNLRISAVPGTASSPGARGVRRGSSRHQPGPGRRQRRPRRVHDRRRQGPARPTSRGTSTTARP